MDTLPAEILSQIFLLASDEDVIFQHGLPTSMAACAWVRPTMASDWSLRTPHEALNVLQRRGYTTKKSMMLTCKAFHRVACELIFHCLFFNGVAKLPQLCALLESTDKEESPAWWTRRLHITDYGLSTMDIASATALAGIWRHCSNMEIAFVTDSIHHTRDTFMILADALCTHNAKSLRSLHISVPISALAKLIWMLASLPDLTCLHVKFTASKNEPTDEEDHPDLGAAHNIRLTMPRLAQLSVTGHAGPFIEQACEWNLPSLRFLSIHSYHDDIIPFLEAHGHDLTFLDITWGYSLRIYIDQALLSCPNLHTLCFNPDFTFETELNHAHIRSVGLHGLGLAFYHPVQETDLDIPCRRANDSNFAAIVKPGNFPKLERVRVLSQEVLATLEKKGGPQRAPLQKYNYREEIEDGVLRWEKWWDACHRIGARLEDCTGGELGVLPGGDEDEELEEGESFETDASGESVDRPSADEEESEEEWEEDSWEYEVPPIDSVSSGVAELRRLIEECREMEKTREPISYKLPPPRKDAPLPAIDTSRFFG